MAGTEYLKVESHFGTVRLFGDLRLSTLPTLTACLYQMVRRAGYKDITLDFSNVTTLTASVVPPLAAYLRHLVRDQVVDFDLVEPRNSDVRERVRSWGLAHYVAHRKYPKPRLKSSDPALIQFMNHEEREVAVDKVVNSALRTARLDRQHVAALDWAVSEITDNVLSHANSGVGGFLISHKQRHSNIIEFTVADAGIGIPRTLGIQDETEAVERAIQEGVTRDKISNQGNGLYGTYRLALGSSGIFILKSRHGNLFVTKEGDMHIRNEPIPYNGTFVVCQIDCDRPDLIERALLIGGRAHTPAFDYIERHHDRESDDGHVNALEICKTFGSRKSGSEARRYLTNIMNSVDSGRVIVDFEGVHVISSSFADEVFGKLFVELGPMRFIRCVQITNAVSAVEGLIDRAISLRAQTGL